MIQENKDSLFELVNNNAGTVNMPASLEKSNKISKSLNELLARAAEEYSDERYLAELAGKLVSNKQKDFASIRSIVLDVQISYDYLMNTIVGLLLIFGRSRYDLRLTPDEGLELIDRIAEIDYAKKAEVVKKLKIFSKKSVQVLWDINDLRRTFAHV